MVKKECVIVNWTSVLVIITFVLLVFLVLRVINERRKIEDILDVYDSASADAAALRERAAQSNIWLANKYTKQADAYQRIADEASREVGGHESWL